MLFEPFIEMVLRTVRTLRNRMYCPRSPVQVPDLRLGLLSLPVPHSHHVSPWDTFPVIFWLTPFQVYCRTGRLH